MEHKTHYIKTFGCQMNKSDSERIATVMEQADYKPISLKEAGIVIFNTCSVRQMAEDRAVGQIHEAKKRNQYVIVTGCLKNQASFVSKNSNVDMFIDINDIADLPKKLKACLRLSPERNDKQAQHPDHITNNQYPIINNYFDITPKAKSKVQSYVPIMTGCDNYCSYCIVPYVRGHEKSRSPESIIKEINSLIKKGYRQITLLGQNVNSYKSNETDFPTLLEQVTNLEGNFRIFFITSHPKDFTKQIIDLIKKYDKLCPYFHLPIQSGSDKILKSMNRKYNCAKYLDLIKTIRREIPDAAITTDIIVGYPGETRENFAETMKICEQVKYDLAYIARFSPRPGTAAAKIEDDVTPAEKKRREQVLTEIVSETALENNKKLVGKITNVLVEKSKDEDGKYTNYGKNEYFKTVKFPSDTNLEDKMVSVKITRVLNWGLYGEIKK